MIKYFKTYVLLSYKDYQNEINTENFDDYDYNSYQV